MQEMGEWVTLRHAGPEISSCTFRALQKDSQLKWHWHEIYFPVQAKRSALKMTPVSIYHNLTIKTEKSVGKEKPPRVWDTSRVCHKLNSTIKKNRPGVCLDERWFIASGEKVEIYECYTIYPLLRVRISQFLHAKIWIKKYINKASIFSQNKKKIGKKLNDNDIRQNIFLTKEAREFLPTMLLY